MDINGMSKESILNFVEDKFNKKKVKVEILSDEGKWEYTNFEDLTDVRYMAINETRIGNYNEHNMGMFRFSAGTYLYREVEE